MLWLLCRCRCLCRPACHAPMQPPPPQPMAAGDWAAAWDIFEGVLPVEGADDEFPALEDLLR